MKSQRTAFILDGKKAEDFFKIKTSKEHNAIIEKRAQSLRKILKDETQKTWKKPISKKDMG